MESNVTPSIGWSRGAANLVSLDLLRRKLDNGKLAVHKKGENSVYGVMVSKQQQKRDSVTQYYNVKNALYIQ